VDLLALIKELMGFALPFLDGSPAIRAILGFILVFFLPGFAWTLVFFSRRQINIVERLALSFGLSIALVTLTILALNLLFGVRITGFNAVLIILTITIIPVVLYYLKKLVKRRGDNTA
jgi:uncharacterized membrane protein